MEHILERKKPKNQAKIDKIREEYNSYLKSTGISTGFEIIFNEIVSKGIKKA